jgi:hypothetical protein
MITFCVGIATTSLTLAGIYWALRVHKAHK